MPNDSNAPNAPDDFESLIQWVALLWGERGWDPHYTVIARLSAAVKEWKKKSSGSTLLNAREWLRALEHRSEVVHRHICIYRIQRGQSPGVYDLDAVMLVGLVAALVDSQEKMQKLLRRYAMDRIDPPILIMEKLPDHIALDLKAGGPNIITAGEWPKTERSVIECSKVVYLRDFFRSFWRRLTKR